MLTKYQLLFTALFCYGFLAIAQPSAVNKADRFRQANDLSNAKSNIDMAITHEKTKNKGRTWFIYGQVHEDILFSEDTKVKALDGKALEHALLGYDKTVDLESEGSNYHTLATLQLENMWSRLLNNGATAYQDGNNKNALKWFELASTVKPKDTTAYLYAGIAAQAINEVPAALKNFKKLVNIDYHKVEIYNSIIFYTKTYEKDTIGTLNWIQKARQQFPSDPTLRKQEINLLIETNKVDDARNGLIQAIAAEPNNANLHFNLGYLYETEGQNLLALKSYRKAVEINPNYFDAQYNLGVYYYNKAADLYKAANELSLSEYNEKGKTMEDEAKSYLRESLPFMEAASNIRPKEPIIWNTLSTIYTRLSMNNKAEAAFKTYDELVNGRQ